MAAPVVAGAAALLLEKDTTLTPNTIKARMMISADKVCDASGNYELYYSRGHKGATIGEHRVYISTYQGKTDENPQVKKEAIPAKYNGKSELKATVGRGANKLNFDLKSGGEIIQPEDDDQPKKGKKGKAGTRMPTGGGIAAGFPGLPEL